jgi:hypothetical protein
MALVYNEFITMMENITSPSYSSTRFDIIIETDGDYEEGDIVVSHSKISSIRNFYNETNDHNRSKMREMINNNVKNIDRVYNMVLEYYKTKQ